MIRYEYNKQNLSEWLLFNAKWAIFQLYVHVYIMIRASHIQWDDDDVHLVLDQQA